MFRLVVLTFVLLVSGSVDAQSTEGKQVEQPASAGNPVKLTVRASREQAASDSNFGITAEIENTSAKTIYLRQEFITMLVPPELDTSKDRLGYDWGSFLAGPGSEITPVVPLEPGSKTIAFWQRQQGLSNFRQFLMGLGFTPGKYTIQVICTYWSDLDKATRKDPDRFTQSTNIQIPIVAPEDVILFGAAIGGIMAFILLPSLWIPVDEPWERKTTAKRVWIVSRGVVVAAILSMMVTILLSRLSETQFLIKVSVSDLWGAIAVGFIVGASGTSILQRFTQTLRSRTPSFVSGVVTPATAPVHAEPDPLSPPTPGITTGAPSAAPAAAE